MTLTAESEALLYDLATSLLLWEGDGSSIRDRLTAIEDAARATLIPYLRHMPTCALQAVRDNAPWDDLCTCGLADAYAEPDR